MGAHHFFTDPEHVRDGRLALVGAEGHHAGHVLRVKPGETISVADGSGKVYDAVVTRVAAEGVEARIILAHDLHVVRPALVLAQGVAKGERMDFVMQKSVELSVRRIEPFLAERGIVRWDEARRAKARERWNAVAVSAAKQCRSPWLTDITEIGEGVESIPDDGVFTVVLHEQAETLLRDALPEQAPETLRLVVGPEGGLAPEEVDHLTGRGAVAVTLGQRILRTETAGPVAAALVSFAYGSLG